MTIVLSTADLQKFERLRDSQLALLELSTDADRLRLVFVDDLGAHTNITLAGLYLISISRHAGEEGNWLVGEISVTATEPGGNEALDRMRFAFVDGSGHAASATREVLYRVHLEGDLVLDAVCGEVSIR